MSRVVDTNRFLIRLIGLVVILIAAFLVIKQQGQLQLDDWKVYVTIGAFALVTYVTHISMVKAIGQRPTLFANRYLASILMKLGVGMVLFIAIAVSSEKPQVLPYGICFIVTYLVFTIFGSYEATILKNET